MNRLAFVLTVAGLAFLLWGVCGLLFGGVADGRDHIGENEVCILEADALRCWQLYRQPEEERRMRLYLTSYNWELGGQNCDQDCGHTAIGLRTGPHLLGKVAACPESWLGLPVWNRELTQIEEWWTSKIIFPAWTGLEPRYCIDNFGDPQNRRPVWLKHPYWHSDSVGEWVLRIDMAEVDPMAFQWNQDLISGWRRTWSPLPAEWYR